MFSLTLSTCRQCRVLQCNAVCCVVLQCVAVCCNDVMYLSQLLLMRTHTRRILGAHTTTHCNTLQYTTTHCNTLQLNATHYNTLQHTRCNSLQPTANLHFTTTLQEVSGSTQDDVDRIDQKSPRFDQKSPGFDQKSPSVDGNSSDGHVLCPPPQVPIQGPTPGKTSDRICQIPLLMNSTIIYWCEFHRVI